MLESDKSKEHIESEFNIGEIIKARERLWRIDQINFHDHEDSKILIYSVSNIDGLTSSQILIPDIESIEKATMLYLGQFVSPLIAESIIPNVDLFNQENIPGLLLIGGITVFILILMPIALLLVNIVNNKKDIDDTHDEGIGV